MSQGNPNKVNAIVDEIVKNNNLFKLKSPIEQDKEKDSIAKSINSALSVLNEVGKELVLQELSVDPDEKFKGFIDSVGNVDVPGLSQMTATIVKAKIEEAEREGIDLRHGQPIFKDNNKTILVEGVLTVAVINEMVNNYDNLTLEQKNIISNNLHLLSHEDRLNYFKNKEKKINESDLDTHSKETATSLNNFNLDLEDKLEYFLSVANGHEQEIINQFIIKQPNYKEIINKFNKNRDKTYSEILSFIITQIQGSVDKKGNTLLDQQVLEKEEAQNMLDTIKNLKDSFENATGQKMDIHNSKLGECLQKYFKSQQRNIKLEEKSQYNANKEQARKDLSETFQGDSISEESKKETLESKLSQKIEQLPSALAKANFSQEEISEALKIYKGTLESLENDDIELLSSGTIDTEKLLKKYLIEDGISQENAEILFKIDYNGQLFEILADETKRKDFFEQLDQVIESEKAKQPIQDEHTDEYYSSQNETLQVDEAAEKIAQEIQARGGSLKELTETLTKKIEEHSTDKSQQTIAVEQPKEPKLSEQIPTVAETKTPPEEHTQEIITSSGQEISEETSQNMAMIEPDNSFIGKVKRVFANMKDMKNKDNSKGFFARLGDSIKNVFGNKKEEYYEKQDTISTNITTEDKSQATNSQQINYLNQHFDVNTQEAIKRTEESKKAKEFLSTEDKETDDLVQ